MITVRIKKGCSLKHDGTTFVENDLLQLSVNDAKVQYDEGRGIIEILSEKDYIAIKEMIKEPDKAIIQRDNEILLLREALKEKEIAESGGYKELYNKQADEIARRDQELLEMKEQMKAMQEFLKANNTDTTKIPLDDAVKISAIDSDEIALSKIDDIVILEDDKKSKHTDKLKGAK